MKERIITLLTDFGTQDYFVGAMKGAILTVNPDAKIIDITHEIAPQDVRSAGFTLENYYKTFPQGTIHVGVVDPGVGSSRRAILAKTADYYFVAPDNGLLSFVFSEENDFRVFELTNQNFFRLPLSRTFHGRDVFAPVAAHLSRGIPEAEFGGEIRDFVRFELGQPLIISPAEISAEIIHIDRFGNLITNLKPGDVPENFVLQVTEHQVLKHYNYYAEAVRGEIFSIFGSAGVLEIASFQDSAKDLLNAKIGDRVLVLKSGD